MKGTDLLAQIRGLLAAAYGSRLRGVVLYGSVARGKERDDSDIDVLVLLDRVADYGHDLRTNLDALYPLARQLGRRISAKPTPVDAYNGGACPLYRNARAEGLAA